MSDQPGLRLTRLALTEFRNYAHLAWRPAGRIAVITGPNGSGKTNLLEAVSLLSPGVGLRAARAGAWPRRIADDAAPVRWAVAGRFAGLRGIVDIGTGAPPEGPGERRVFRLDGVAPRSQSEIAAHVAMLWLTPQMDRLFQEGAAGRRRFLDRLVWPLEPGHAREISAYGAAMLQRNRLLAQGGADTRWLASLEDAMARHAVAASVARRALLARLNATIAEGTAIADDAAGAFPPAHLALLCPIAARLEHAPALAVEDWLRDVLAAGRAGDAAAGAARAGAHRADLAMRDLASGEAAERASTGQQKALLLSVVLGHAALLTAARGTPPLLLLDEPMVHLDAPRRAALCAALRRMPAQALLSGTDAEPFAPLRGDAEWLRCTTDSPAEGARLAWE